jgi:hypothetical protein
MWMFADFLKIGEYLLNEGYKDAAAREHLA